MEFRLVKILPEKMSKLKCEISHWSLDDAPGYIAISVSTFNFHEQGKMDADNTLHF